MPEHWMEHDDREKNICSKSDKKSTRFAMKREHGDLFSYTARVATLRMKQTNKLQRVCNVLNISGK